MAERFPELPRAQCEGAVQLIEPDGTIYAGAEAAFRALATNPAVRWPREWYERWPLFARLTDWGYGYIARHRVWFSRLTRLAWGAHVDPATHFVGRWVFLRSLALIYLIAFLSLWTQILGLVGARGILPATFTMLAVRQQMSGTKAANSSRQVEPKSGFEQLHLVPTLCWFGTGDGFLKFQCIAGAALALLLLIGVAPAPCLFLLWLIYLSLATVCREFLGFQWDNLLLETGFLAIFLAPLQWRPAIWRTSPPARVALWLLRWLLFRLMFASGWVKLMSGDPTWRNLTALNFHYETQPLPTWIGWYAHHLPGWFQRSSTLLMFIVEIGVPILIFAPRRLRNLGGLILIAFQVVILLTGNYCFFNLLTIALCVLLFDDATILDAARLRNPRSPMYSQNLAPEEIKRWRWPKAIALPLTIVILTVSLMEFAGMFRLAVPWPRPLLGVYEWLAPFRSINNYGLFAVMTTSRPEIVIEGSDDGVNWSEYEFKYKPGDLRRRPRFVEPHQPRLDWQMWFAALGNYQQNPWLIYFGYRILEGAPEVLRLMARNPFPDRPPRYLRAVVYDYHFTDLATHWRTGDWWRRERKGIYLPAISLHGG